MGRVSNRALNALFFVHRWLGIAGALLFILWFVSGIAMMYVRMPEVSDEERLTHTPAIDADAIHVSIAEASAVAGIDSANAVQLATLGGRPVYRFAGQRPAVVFADRSERFNGLSPGEATAIAATFAPVSRDTLRHLGLVEVPDQWTLQSRAHLPLHHIALGDAAGTELYVSNRTGEVVMDTTRRERLLAYLGPVAHWLYVPVLRRNGPLWTRVIIWTSIAGCGLCLTGLLAGVLRFSPRARFSMRGNRAMSPYDGWLKWHHYAGLLFGVITFTWVFSGLLSMGPFPPLLASGGVTAEQRRAVRGDPVPVSALSAEDTRAAVRAARSQLEPKDLALFQFRGHVYWLAREDAHHRVIVGASDHRPFARFDTHEIEAVARDAVPGARIVGQDWLDRHDAYYYDRNGARPLPVLRVKYDDPQQTWIYFDPARGAIAHLARRPDRANRWLYHGLHSLDFPFFYQSRPAWDLAVIVLSLGGVAGAVTSLVPGWRRVARLGIDLRGRAR